MDTTEGDRLRGGALALRIGNDPEGRMGRPSSTAAEPEPRVRDDDMKVRGGETLYSYSHWSSIMSTILLVGLV